MADTQDHLGEPLTPDEAASKLCRSCGLCCSGVLFSQVPLEPSEVQPARVNGLTVFRLGESDRFVQPCTAFAGDRCRIYDQRPATCKGFRCQLLKRTLNGEIPLEVALSKVALILGIVRGLGGHALRPLPIEARDRSSQREPARSPVTPVIGSDTVVDRAALDMLVRRYLLPKEPGETAEGGSVAKDASLPEAGPD